MFGWAIQPFEQFLGRAGNNTHGIWNTLFIGTRCSHGIGLARAGLSVRQQRDIVALQERVDTFAEILPHALLVDRLRKDAIENEQLTTLRDINGHTGGSSDMNHGTLESLGDQFEAGIRGFQGRSNSDGYSISSCLESRESLEGVPWPGGRGTEKQTNFDGGFCIFIGSATPSTVFTAHTEPAITARSARDGTESGRCARRRARGGDRHDPGFLNQRSRVKRSQENRSDVLKRENRHRVSILVVCVVVAVGVVVTRGFVWNEGFLSQTGIVSLDIQE